MIPLLRAFESFGMQDLGKGSLYSGQCRSSRGTWLECCVIILTVHESVNLIRDNGFNK